MSKITNRQAAVIYKAFEIVVSSTKSDYIGLDMHPQELADYWQSFIRIIKDHEEPFLADVLADDEMIWEQEV